MAFLALVALIFSATPAAAASPPTVEGLNPNHGRTAGGRAIHIRGTNFTGATAVHFGATEVNYTVASPRQIHAVVPQGLGTVDVTVTTPDGTSAVSPADEYTYEARPPAIKKTSPRVGPASGGTTVTLSGEHFLGTTSVSFGAMPATSFTVNSDTSITAVSPGESVGRIVIAVTTPYGESSPEYCGPKGNKLHCSVHDYFDYKELTVTGVSPSSGSTLGGTSVTISGAGFELGSSGTTFLFGKDVASDVECISSTECTAVSPAHKAGTVDVRAQVAGPHTKITSPGVPADQFLFVG